ncbi:ATP synthase subunit b, mitochondrial-like [Choristoneura fumiferana]|uniref:ATP synthase subunit b, mitochondrial-like n=1 Tax=Choristoneura fumiferana TaxID=7141 RepID=UPI003D15D9EB
MMIIRPIISSVNVRELVPKVLCAHTKTCPGSKGKKGAGTPCGKGGAKGAAGSGGKTGELKRADRSGAVRLGFLPDEWFTFFHNKTGVTGPYILLFNLSNYLVSKEIYVMEHEFYLGLSALVVIIYVTKTFGKDIGASLDKEVDAVTTEWEKGRKDEMAFFEATIKGAKEAQNRAQGQKMLMDAKKENVLMQIEAVYRERAMLVYRAVRGRMDYHIKRYQAVARIHQKWMIGWILENVRKSITPEFEKQALESAIQELSAVAGRVK